MATLTISPAEEKRVKGMGFLSNKGTDNFSARIITVNGKVTAEQLQVITEAAQKFGNGVVTFTTRLTVEVQGVPFDKIEEFQAYIAKAGLVTGEPVPKCVRWFPVRVPPVSTVFWILSGFPKKSITDSMKATGK